MSVDLALRQVALVTDDLETVVEQLGAVFGLTVAFRDPLVARFGLTNVVLPVGDEFLEVIAPSQDGTSAGRFLERRRGPGGYMIILQSSDPDFADRQSQRHNARLVFGFDEDGFRCRQFHPADTGGMFLEINHQHGEGRWHPAGPNWHSAQRTDILSGIASVTVQSPDPAALTARWAEITDLRPSRGPALAFANAALAVVPLGDSRGAGLTTISVHAVDADHARTVADARGLLHEDGTVEICGVRFELVPRL
jgi:hypothetical protein